MSLKDYLFGSILFSDGGGDTPTPAPEPSISMSAPEIYIDGNTSVEGYATAVPENMPDDVFVRWFITDNIGTVNYSQDDKWNCLIYASSSGRTTLVVEATVISTGRAYSASVPVIITNV